LRTVFIVRHVGLGAIAGSSILTYKVSCGSGAS
jgi:hypothetical protein